MSVTTDFSDFTAVHFPDRRVIQCNLTTSQKTAAKGARAYAISTNPGGGADRIVILLRSRSGRWIEKWQDIRTLANFRVKTLPIGHPLYSHSRIGAGVFDPDATAAHLNRMREHWQVNR